ncbi:MAG: DUF1684 domain-containing protein [Flavobacteriales bacterium]|nr:DUF1684 domain-containing protein [Flavobacteriales bacterium]
MRPSIASITVILAFTFTGLSLQGFAQGSILADNAAYRQQLNAEYADTVTSPLSRTELALFTELPFYPIDTVYAVLAQFERFERPKTIDMPTTAGTTRRYDIYGMVHFSLNGKDHRLFLYQSHQLRNMPQYSRHLLLAFKDLTSGATTYGGGRFIDVEIPEGDTLPIDFNKAYNPYCAYSTRYACPITPEENFLNTEVTAGVRFAP